MRKYRRTHTIPRRASAGLFVALYTLLAATTASADPDLTVGQVDHLIEEMLFDQVEAAIAEYREWDSLAIETLYLESRQLFFAGDYEQALVYADQALLLSDAPPHYVIGHRALVAATAEEVAGYEEYTTSGGHFVIRYQPGRDEVLMPYADETLEAAYANIGADFGYYPPEPVRVEFYPTTTSLANVSSLSVEAIETSGTIALCKYNRLMVTSPRSLVRGYRWRDTVRHEYVHLVIQRLTGTRVPIWLHEGLAKFEESRWRGERRDLPPSNQDLLARRLDDDNLITFEQMHPSMALLPSQEDTGTAFAEVYTVIEFLVQSQGPDALQRLVWEIHEGAEVQAAVETITGNSFAVFLDEWDTHLREREYRRLPGDFVDDMQFMPDSASDAAPDELAGIAEEEARDYMHLGQLLRARDRVQAAIIEYRKAESLVGSDNPVLQNWLAQALLDLDRPLEAIGALGEAAEYYPTFYMTFLHLAQAHMRLGQADQALPHLIEAAGINPFDPAVHEELIRAYTALERTQEAAAANDAWQVVLGQR